MPAYGLQHFITTFFVSVFYRIKNGAMKPRIVVRIVLINHDDDDGRHVHLHLLVLARGKL